MARRGAWSPATHCNWPDAFKAATNTLLLACCRTVGSGAGSVAASRGARPAPAGLASLPADVLLRILQLAAAPMSAWLKPCWDYCMAPWAPSICPTIPVTCIAQRGMTQREAQEH